MALNRDVDLNKVKWVEWENRNGLTQAHAVDPSSEARTGVLRTFTGAAVPANAVAAKPTTTRDASSEAVLKRIADLQAERASTAVERAQAKADAEAKKAAKEAAKAAKAEAQAKARVEKAEAAAKAKETRAAEREKAKTAKLPEGNGKLKKSKDQWLCLNDAGEQVGAFAAGLLDLERSKDVRLHITDKVWVVNQVIDGKAVKVAQGAIQKPKAEKAEKAAKK